MEDKENGQNVDSIQDIVGNHDRVRYVFFLLFVLNFKSKNGVFAKGFNRGSTTMLVVRGCTSNIMHFCNGT